MSAVNKKGLSRLLRLMTETEKRSFKAEFQLSEDASDAAIVKAIEKLPRYEAVRAFVRVADPTLVLLREVFEMLSGFRIATKTTGCVFVLANPAKPGEPTELVFSQQTVGAICSWTSLSKGSRPGSSLTELQTTWNRFRPIWNLLLGHAQPKRKINYTTLARNKLSGILLDPFENKVDERAQGVLAHFMERVAQMEDRLSQVPDEIRPEELTSILRSSRQLRSAAAHYLGPRRPRSAAGQRQRSKSPSVSVIHTYTRRDFSVDFDKFLEDLYSTADLIRGEGLVDMLQIDVWSARPQLFEVWVLLKVLAWFHNRGYQIELLKTDNPGGPSPIRWNLSYAKDSSPCAIVRNGQTGLEQFLFYQLYRSSGDMPDISLLEGSDPLSAPIWSVDPKHSAKDGYSLAHYQKTAKRYRDRFGATLSLVVEYFDRPTLGDANPLEFGPGAKLIRSCRPDGSGLPILLDELGGLHPALHQSLVCIDYSSSFAPQRDAVWAALRQRYKSGLISNVASKCILFAGNALVLNSDEWLTSERILTVSPEGLREGTAAEPLLTEISRLKRTVPFSEVLLVTDGDFDIPIESLTKRIQEQLGLAVRLETMEVQQ